MPSYFPAALTTSIDGHRSEYALKIKMKRGGGSEGGGGGGRKTKNPNIARCVQMHIASSHSWRDSHPYFHRFDDQAKKEEESDFCLAHRQI